MIRRERQKVSDSENTATPQGGNAPRGGTPQATVSLAGGAVVTGRPAPLAGSTAVLVLGMHRSGTSAVSGVLHHLGVHLGRAVSPAGPSNPKGYFENTRVMLLHEDLLASLGSAWDDPRPLPAGWSEENRLAPWRERLAAILDEEFGGASLWGVKDPRLCRLLPLWLPLLAGASVRTVAVLVLRHPLAVAASNARRTGMPREQALELWLGHTLAAELNTRGVPRAVVSYEYVLADWRQAMGELARRLDLPLAFDLAHLAQAAALLERDLQHHRGGDLPGALEPFQEWSRRAWEALSAWSRDDRPAAGTLDDLAAERARWAPAAIPVSQFLDGKIAAGQRRDAEKPDGGEQVAAVRAELERLRGERSLLAAELAQRQRQVDDLTTSLRGITSTRWFKAASWYWTARARLARPSRR